MPEFVKRNMNAPHGFFACEAVGLAWLGGVAGGVPCARVVRHDETSLTLERLRSAPPSVDAARTFGRRLAVTHDAGASGFGAPPQGWNGPGFFGPLSRPLPMSLSPHDSWGRFYAKERLAPMLEHAAAGLDGTVKADVGRVVKRCAEVISTTATGRLGCMVICGAAM